jgi:hypothetical protein
MTTDISPTITCPKCGEEIQLTEALLYPFQDKWKRQWETESKKRLEAEKEKEQEEANRTIEELRSELKQKDKKLKETQDYERELRSKIKNVEDREQELDLEVARKLDEEKKKSGEQHHLELREKDEQISNMQRQIEDLKRKSDQISPQARGDALQYELDEILASAFPDDDIEVVKRGQKGADILQRVKDKGKLCGTILWESKNTLRWNAGWIEKLKSDQRDKKANIAVLASRVVPEGIQHFGTIENVWVTSLSVVCGLADALRFGLIEVASSKLALVGIDRKVEALYGYFASPQFKQRIEPIVEALCSMQDQINGERRAMERIWAERQKEIEKAIKGAAGFYGDIGGIVGGALLPEIERLQLPQPAED